MRIILPNSPLITLVSLVVYTALACGEDVGGKNVGRSLYDFDPRNIQFMESSFAPNQFPTLNVPYQPENDKPSQAYSPPELLPLSSQRQYSAPLPSIESGESEQPGDVVSSGTEATKKPNVASVDGGSSKPPLLPEEKATSTFGTAVNGASTVPLSSLEAFTAARLTTKEEIPFKSATVVDDAARTPLRQSSDDLSTSQSLSQVNSDTSARSTPSLNQSGSLFSEIVPSSATTKDRPVFQSSANAAAVKSAPSLNPSDSPASEIVPLSTTTKDKPAFQSPANTVVVKSTSSLTQSSPQVPATAPSSTATRDRPNLQSSANIAVVNPTPSLHQSRSLTTEIASPSTTTRDQTVFQSSSNVAAAKSLPSLNQSGSQTPAPFSSPTTTKDRPVLQIITNSAVVKSFPPTRATNMQFSMAAADKVPVVNPSIFNPLEANASTSNALEAKSTLTKPPERTSKATPLLTRTSSGVFLDNPNAIVSGAPRVNIPPASSFPISPLLSSPTSITSKFTIHLMPPIGVGFRENPNLSKENTPVVKETKDVGEKTTPTPSTDTKDGESTNSHIEDPPREDFEPTKPPPDEPTVPAPPVKTKEFPAHPTPATDQGYTGNHDGSKEQEISLPTTQEDEPTMSEPNPKTNPAKHSALTDFNDPGVPTATSSIPTDNPTPTSDGSDSAGGVPHNSETGTTTDIEDVPGPGETLITPSPVTSETNILKDEPTRATEIEPSESTQLGSFPNQSKESTTEAITPIPNSNSIPPSISTIQSSVETPFGSTSGDSSNILTAPQTRTSDQAALPTPSSNTPISSSDTLSQAGASNVPLETAGSLPTDGYPLTRYPTQSGPSSVPKVDTSGSHPSVSRTEVPSGSESVNPNIPTTSTESASSPTVASDTSLASNHSHTPSVSTSRHEDKSTPTMGSTVLTRLLPTSTETSHSSATYATWLPSSIQLTPSSTRATGSTQTPSTETATPTETLVNLPEVIVPNNEPSPPADGVTVSIHLLSIPYKQVCVDQTLAAQIVNFLPNDLATVLGVPSSQIVVLSISDASRPPSQQRRNIKRDGADLKGVLVHLAVPRSLVPRLEGVIQNQTSRLYTDPSLKVTRFIDNTYPIQPHETNLALTSPGATNSPQNTTGTSGGNQGVIIGVSVAAATIIYAALTVLFINVYKRHKQRKKSVRELEISAPQLRQTSLGWSSNWSSDHSRH
ncbi:uncharacterized protein VTP21DRAFT_5873 [Calcarisporiella thermophila]|uniref:uncharacterized protein n=1 Tax=Calcarisporiella thermophila TaxID=911321 RepID=UPI003744AA17